MVVSKITGSDGQVHVTTVQTILDQLMPGLVPLLLKMCIRDSRRRSRGNRADQRRLRHRSGGTRLLRSLYRVRQPGDLYSLLYGPVSYTHLAVVREEQQRAGRRKRGLQAM